MLFCMTVVPGCWALLVLAARKNTMLYAITMPTAQGIYPIDMCGTTAADKIKCNRRFSSVYFNPDVLATRDIMNDTKALLSK